MASSAALPNEPLYHLVQEKLWRDAVATGQPYYPPTYDKDGFTHATANASFLLGVANHFYTDIEDNFLCLVIDPRLLKHLVKYEAAAAVGDKESYQGTGQADAPVFPHIYGPIEPESVVRELKVERNAKGEFLTIESI